MQDFDWEYHNELDQEDFIHDDELYEDNDDLTSWRDYYIDISPEEVEY